MLYSLISYLLLFTAAVHAVPREIETLKNREAAAKCKCAGANNTGNTQYLCGDPRLGPVQLPTTLPLSGAVYSYSRFGKLHPKAFLAKWTDPTTGAYRYPPQNGYLLDANGNAIRANTTLPKNTLIDRFGSEYGSYVSAADAPYNQRALPPSNLDTNPSAPDFPYNYHVYRVIKEFSVEAGPIAPWFSQPGLGAQFYIGYTGMNIMGLVDNGYLRRVPAETIMHNENPCNGD